MSNSKSGNIASLMMLLWLAVYAAVAFFLPQWGDFATIIACTLPMVLFKKKHRGITYGASDCNTLKYKKHEYIPFFVFTISGTALVSALTFLALNAAGLASSHAGQSKGFFFMLVFSCFLPAFFEEWLLRGGVLGALQKHGGAGVWMCAVLFMLMHLNPVKWPYALFAGLCITALVYLTECIYLGMLLHFLNNFTSLLLSYLNGVGEYIALLVLAVLFALSAVLLRRTKLLKDVKVLLTVSDFSLFAAPAFIVFALAAILFTLCFII